jgi:hypothetical protein
LHGNNLVYRFIITIIFQIKPVYLFLKQILLFTFYQFLQTINFKLSHIKIGRGTRGFIYWILFMNFLYLQFRLFFLFKKLLITSHACFKKLFIFDFIYTVPVGKIKVTTIFVFYFVCLFLLVWGYSTWAYLVLMIYHWIFILDIWHYLLIVCHIFIYYWKLAIIWLNYKFILY